MGQHKFQLEENVLNSYVHSHILKKKKTDPVNGQRCTRVVGGYGTCAEGFHSGLLSRVLTFVHSYPQSKSWNRYAVVPVV
jgi:hypothetical protein